MQVVVRSARPIIHLANEKGRWASVAELGYASRDYASFFESALASCVLSTMPP